MQLNIDNKKLILNLLINKAYKASRGYGNGDYDSFNFWRKDLEILASDISELLDNK